MPNCFLFKRLFGHECEYPWPFGYKEWSGAVFSWLFSYRWHSNCEHWKWSKLFSGSMFSYLFSFTVFRSNDDPICSQDPIELKAVEYASRCHAFENYHCLLWATSFCTSLLNKWSHSIVGPALAVVVFLLSATAVATKSHKHGENKRYAEKKPLERTVNAEFFSRWQSPQKQRSWVKEHEHTLECRQQILFYS